MSYNLNKLVRLSALQELAQKIANLFVSKEEAPFIITFTSDSLYAEITTGTIDKTNDEVKNAIDSKKQIICKYEYYNSSNNKYYCTYLPDVDIHKSDNIYSIKAYYWTVLDPTTISEPAIWRRCVWTYNSINDTSNIEIQFKGD